MGFALSQTRASPAVTGGLRMGLLPFLSRSSSSSTSGQGAAEQGQAQPQKSGQGIRICGIKAPSGLEIHEPVYRPPLADLPSEQD